MRLSPRLPYEGQGSLALQAEARSAALIWSVCVAASLITARRLLLANNGQFPLLLLLLQLLATCAWRVAHPPRQGSPPSSPTLQEQPANLKRLTLALLDVVGCASSVPLYAMAVLYFQNTAVLAMLSVSVFVHPMVASIMTGNMAPGFYARRLCLLLVALALVMRFEFRLTTPGMFFAVGSYGIYGFLQSIRYMLDHETASVKPGLNSFPAIALSMGVTCIAVLATEDMYAARMWLTNLDISLLAVLALNLISTVMAIRIGGHVMVFNGGFDRISWVGLQQPTMVWPVACVSGIVGVYTSHTQTSVVNFKQICSFMVAAAVTLDIDFRSIYLQLVSDKLPFVERLPCLTALLPRDRLLGSPRLFFVDDDVERTPRRDSVARKSLGEMEAKKSPATRVLIFITIFCWISTLWFNVIHSFVSPQSIDKPLLDTKYKPHSEVDIVITSQLEHPSEIAKTMELLTSIPQISTKDFRVFVYSKNYQADLELIRQAVLPYVDIPSIMLMHNIGDAGESYIAHILGHWETLGNHTIFLPAVTSNPRELRSRIANFFAPETGMLPLGAADTTCSCESDTCADSLGWSDTSGVIRDVFLHANRRSVCRPGEQLLVSSGGQKGFIASAARIRGVNRDIFHQLRTWLIDETSWIHREPFLAHRNDQLVSPVFGETLDRLWAPLLQCADPRIASMCPSALSGWRSGGRLSDCQCLDDGGPIIPVVRDDHDLSPEDKKKETFKDAVLTSSEASWAHVWSTPPKKVAVGGGRQKKFGLKTQ